MILDSFHEQKMAKIIEFHSVWSSQPRTQALAAELGEQSNILLNRRDF